jgi:hypothetical protein
MPDFFGETRLEQIGNARLHVRGSVYFIRSCPQIVPNIRDSGAKFRL